MNRTNGIFFNKELQNDDVFVTNKMVSMESLTGMQLRRGLEKAVISNGKIVNVVSESYGHLSNQNFFASVEEKLIDADINYLTRSINRDDRSFSVDYILNDESYQVNIKTGKDTLRPMLRFTNSYDGSCKTSGHFGFFRQVCSNGLHVAETKIGFSVKHRGDIAQVVLPEISGLIKKFTSNEYYSLHKKFEVLAERPITNLETFVKATLGKVELFQYQASEKNTGPSLNARMVIETVQRESRILGVRPNAWLGYNAFNEVLHGKLKKTFEAQKKLDGQLFSAVMELS